MEKRNIKRNGEGVISRRRLENYIGANTVDNGILRHQER